MKKFFRFLFGKPQTIDNLSHTLVLKECANCGTKMHGHYCQNCGQKRIDKHDVKISHFFGEIFHAFTHFDGKFFATIKSLFRRPGFLTFEFIRGHRNKYMKPIQIFLISNIFYFLIPTFNTYTTPLKIYMSGILSKQEMVEKKLKQENISYATYEAEFDAHEKGNAKTLIIIMIPVFAGLISFLFLKQRRYFVEQLVFSTHFFSFLLFFSVIGMYTFYLLVTLIALGIWKIFGANVMAHNLVGFFNSDDGMTIFMSTIMFIYFFIAIKKVFFQSNFESFFKAFASVLFYWITVYLYREVLFFVTFYGIKVGLH